MTQHLGLEGLFSVEEMRSLWKKCSHLLRVLSALLRCFEMRHQIYRSKTLKCSNCTESDTKYTRS